MNDRFIRACRREPVDCTPVWFMRQAGRYMAEYRALREKHTMLEVCRTPELAVEVTLQPIRAFPFDAAILFSDLLVPLAPLGIPFDFHKGEGPVIEKPVATATDVAALRRFEPRDELGYVLEAIRLLRRELPVPLIGFAGAPFTLASYVIEGGHSSHFAKTKGLMYGDPGTWHKLAALLAEVVRRLPARPGRGRRPGGAAVRLLGRRARRDRLPRAGAAAREATSSTRYADPTCP